MEIRDLYDKNKKLTGKTIQKGQKIPEGNYIIVVLTMIRNSRGEFLIQKRSKQKDGLYGATGGHCKSGETGLQGAITEIREELGLEVEPEEMRLLFEGREDEQQVFFELYFLQKDIDLNTLKLQTDEVESVEWMNMDKINNLVNKSQFLMNHVEEVYRTIEILEKEEK